jgi:hypothetical protein
MKKILIALAIAGFTYISAEAQTAPLIPCAAPKGKVCKRSGNGVSCYKTPYAEDFKVCKGDYGYFVCCETPNATNSTHPSLPVTEAFTSNDYQGYMNEAIVLNSSTSGDNQAVSQIDMRVPQSQSYPPYSNTACATPGGCISRRNYIKASCYGGNNVAELNRAPYNGCPTPAYDGPEENKARNINSNDPLNSMPPLTGRPQQ